MKMGTLGSGDLTNAEYAENREHAEIIPKRYIGTN
jgi:hypothetical protein